MNSYFVVLIFLYTFFIFEDYIVFGKTFPGTFDLIDERVVGGTPAPDGSIPYQVSLRDSSNRHYCGGSILNDRWILTAAHCVKAINPTFVVLGTNKRTQGGAKYNVEKVIPHPKYDSEKIVNDVALVMTNSSIKFTDRVKPIKLATQDTPAGSDLVLTGWGKTSHPGNVPDDLQYIRLSSISYEECNVKLAAINPVTERQICTFTRIGEGACHGDSGGPLVKADKSEVVGIVSWGYPCARDFPDVFARVFSYKDWIKAQMAPSKKRI